MLTLFTGLSLFPMSVTAAEAEDGLGTTERFCQDFNSLREEAKFTTSHSNFGISYVTGQMQVVKQDKGMAVNVKSCDMRWWNITYSDDEYHFTFDVSFPEEYSNTNLSFCVTNDDGSTNTEGLTGTVVKIAGKSKIPTLQDRNGNVLKELAKDGTVYTIHIKIPYGSQTYSLYCNDELVSDSLEFVSPTYTINGMRFNVASGGKDTYLTLDNIRFYSRGRQYPQKFSYQEKGKMPSIQVPAEPVDDGTDFWLNTEKLDPPAGPMVENGTAYLPLQWTAEKMGGTVSGNTVTYGGKSYTVSGNTLSGAKSVTMTNSTKEIDGVLCAPARAFSEIFHAKVWYDEAHDMVVFTTGSYKTDNVFRKLGSYFYLNGEPYYEFSWNKFDLHWQILYDAQFNNGKYPSRDFPNAASCVQAAEEALAELHEHGFKTIRVFISPYNADKLIGEALENYWAATDLMFDLCDKYEIRIVPCLTLTTSDCYYGSYEAKGKWTPSLEGRYDLVCVADSKSRENCYRFIDAFVGRYKDRDTVLMWELDNEGNLQTDIGTATGSITYSLLQLGSFYTDCANRIRQIDNTRLIGSGDSVLRTSQYRLFTATMKGSRAPDWGTDTALGRLSALRILNESLDVISVHGYGVGYTDSYVDTDKKTKNTTFELFLKEAERLGLALYNGETDGRLTEKGRQETRDFANTTEKLTQARAYYFDTIIEAGVQLTHFWAFRSDRATQQSTDRAEWSVRTTDGSVATFNAVKDANAKLKSTYHVNPIAGENGDFTDEIPAVTEPAAEAVTEPATETGSEAVTEPESKDDDSAKEPTERKGNSAVGIIIGVIAAAAAVCVVLAVILKKKKNA